MQNDEEFFIVRFAGPKKSRDAIYDYLTGKSTDFQEYSQFFNEMDVKRVQSLGDFFSAMNNIGSASLNGQTPQKSPSPAPKATEETVKTLPKPQKIEEIFKDEEKPSSLLDMEIPSTSTSTNIQKPSEHPKIVKLKRKIEKTTEILSKKPKPESFWEPKREPSESIPMYSIAPHWSDNGEKVITSQTLKLHNISFEKKKT